MNTQRQYTAAALFADMRTVLCAVGGFVGLVLVAPTLHAQWAGSLDPAFDPNIAPGYVLATAVDVDGRVVIGGYFLSRIARLNADGSVESTATFNPGTGPNGGNASVFSVAIQPDGKILLGGQFTSVDGQTRKHLARLNTDGSVESTATFNPGTGANADVLCITVQADGKILLGGDFASVNGQSRNHLARLNADGSVESTATFNPGTGANAPIYSMAVQADGKIILGGEFTTVNDEPRNYFARLNADGTVESTVSFNPGTGADGVVDCVAVQPDGKILLGGNFTSVDGQSPKGIARLNADGSVERTATFNPGTGANHAVFCMALQADGKIVLGGFFTTINGQPRSCIARLRADGSVESTATFNPGTGANSGVYSAVLQENGKILLGGQFTSVSGQTRNSIARLTNDAVIQSLAAPSGNRVFWARDGSVPEVECVTFELSTNSGATWSPLGVGTRVSGGWECNGLSLPANGSIRARGRAVCGGYFNGSSGRVEMVTVYPDVTPPTLSLPDDIVAEATAASGRTVNYIISATDVNEPVQLTSAPTTGSTFALGQTAVNVKATDGAGNTQIGTFTVTVRDTTAPTASVSPTLTVNAGPTTAAALGDLTANVTASDLVGVTSIVQSPDASSVRSLGSYPVSFTVSDAAGNSTMVETTVTVVFQRSSLVAVTIGSRSGQAASGGTVLSTFGAPAMSDFRDLAARVTILAFKTKLAGIHVEDGAGLGDLAAYQGGPVPGITTTGVTFKSFLDPVIAPGGSVAFAGKVTGGGVKAAADCGVWTDAFGNGLELALREGSDVPGLPAGAKLKAVTSLSLRDGELLALLTLAPAKGLVTTSNDTMLLRMTGASTATVQLREGSEVPGLIGSKIKSFSVLSPALGSSGHGRWHADDVVVAKVGLVDGRTLLVKIAPNGTLTALLSTAEAATPVDPEAKWKAFGLPAVGSTGAGFVVAATLKPNAGGVTAKDDTALLFSSDGTGWSVFARENGAAPMAPDAAGPLYASFFDPVVNDAGQVAFLATLQGAGIKASNKTGLFCGTTDQLRLRALLGDAVPDEGGTATTAVWSKFISCALPSGTGASVVFLAETSGGDTTAKNKLALWAVDSTGTLRRLLRTDDALTVGGSPITGLTLFNAVPGAFGAARSYNATGSVALLATFADKTQALLRVDIP